MGTEVRRRNCQVGVRLTQDEYNIIEQAAAEQGVTMPEFLRLRGLEPERDRPAT
jgi:uncharacterized protein (DUF1778 family)